MFCCHTDLLVSRKRDHGVMFSPNPCGDRRVRERTSVICNHRRSPPICFLGAPRQALPHKYVEFSACLHLLSVVDPQRCRPYGKQSKCYTSTVTASSVRSVPCTRVSAGSIDTRSATTLF